MRPRRIGIAMWNCVTRRDSYSDFVVSWRWGSEASRREASLAFPRPSLSPSGGIRQPARPLVVCRRRRGGYFYGRGTSKPRIVPTTVSASAISLAA